MKGNQIGSCLADLKLRLRRHSRLLADQARKPRQAPACGGIRVYGGDCSHRGARSRPGLSRSRECLSAAHFADNDPGPGERRMVARTRRVIPGRWLGVGAEGARSVRHWTWRVSLDDLDVAFA